MRCGVDAQRKAGDDSDARFGEGLGERLCIALALCGGCARTHHGQSARGVQQGGVAQCVEQGWRVGDFEQALRISRIVQSEANVRGLRGPVQRVGDEIARFAVRFGQQRRGDRCTD